MMLSVVLLPLAFASASSAQSCVFKDIDYNVLTRTETESDYRVQSPNYENYEYVFNVCADIKFQDDMCIPGTAFCERVTATGEGNDVYGLTSTARFVEEENEVYMTMNTNGEFPCAFGGDMESRIYFECGPVETVEAVDESYTDCHIYVKITSPEICQPQNLKYRCVDDTCVQSESGESKEECAESCGPQEIKYRCVDDTCVQSESGESEQECAESCGPQEIKYRCVDNTCVQHESGISERECAESCGPPSTFEE